MLLERGVGIGHEIGARLAQHHLEVCGLEADVDEAVDGVGWAGHAVPRTQHRLDPVAGAVLEEDLDLPAEDEEHLFDFVRVRGIALTGRDEHHAEGEVLRRDDACVGLTRGAAPDEAMLGAPVPVDARVGEGIPIPLAIGEARHLAGQEIIQRLRHIVASPPGSDPTAFMDAV